MSYDYYQEADELIKMLSASSLEKYGEALQKAMDEGSTGTEIFMALRWNLDKILSEASTNDLIEAKTQKLRDEIDKALS